MHAPSYRLADAEKDSGSVLQSISPPSAPLSAIVKQAGALDQLGKLCFFSLPSLAVGGGGEVIVGRGVVRTLSYAK